MKKTHKYTLFWSLYRGFPYRFVGIGVDPTIPRKTRKVPKVLRVGTLFMDYILHRIHVIMVYLPISPDISGT